MWQNLQVKSLNNSQELIPCSCCSFSVLSQPFSLRHYRMFQLMRFSVEEINNSTNLLPNISLGYEIFDHCSDTQSFPDILNLISSNGMIQPWHEPHEQQTSPYKSKVIAVVGPRSSTQTLTVAPLFMVDLIPMVSFSYLYQCSIVQSRVATSVLQDQQLVQPKHFFAFKKKSYLRHFLN